ncbi:helix-turn-helix domain-containing protein [Hymenobacter jeollabukensis]|uniref:HTH cro/C1-type domain-containing protein n=1 Tax=Hymenobacter jeollabukensis TaxID=2025313 RepID=A0A5R8WS06_9BACT|nr:hypothetical protein [Hymenobacter jeollabukensis]TLM93912.1 hypothetical protein FDY95_07720 [Hymenobacter jeollabukensis]
MPQKAIPSATLTAAVRAYLGLSQLELARFLGVTRGQVAHVEAGRKLLGPESRCRLSQLADLLPAPLGLAPAEPAAPAPASSTLPAAAPLRQRLARCRRRAAQLQQALAQHEARSQQARRWEQILPALEAAVAADAGPGAAGRRQWVAARQAEAHAALAADEAAAELLLTVRLRHLQAEAAELAQLLADFY